MLIVRFYFLQIQLVYKNVSITGHLKLPQKTIWTMNHGSNNKNSFLVHTKHKTALLISEPSPPSESHGSGTCHLVPPSAGRASAVATLVCISGWRDTECGGFSMAQALVPGLNVAQPLLPIVCRLELRWRLGSLSQPCAR